MVAAATGCLPEYTTTGPLDTPECNAGAWLGRFHGNANGAVSDTLAGCAYYSSTTANAIGPVQPMFGLVLTDGNPQTPSLKIRIWILGGRASGTQIPVGGGQGEVSGFVLVGDRSFALSSGSVSLSNVVSTDGSTLMKSGLIDLTGVESETGATITVTGEFLAKGV
jgi:hypothetical protein